MDDTDIERQIEKMMALSPKVKEMYETESYRLRFEDPDDVTDIAIRDTLLSELENDLPDHGIELKASLQEAEGPLDGPLDALSLILLGLTGHLREDPVFRDRIETLLSDPQDDPLIIQLLDLIASSAFRLTHLFADAARSLRPLVQETEVFVAHVQKSLEDARRLSREDVTPSLIMSHLLRFRETRQAVQAHVSQALRRGLITADYADILDFSLFRDVRAFTADAERFPDYVHACQLLDHDHVHGPDDVKAARKTCRTLELDSPLFFSHMRQRKLVDEDFTLEEAVTVAMIPVFWESSFRKVPIKKSYNAFIDLLLELFGEDEDMSVLAATKDLTTFFNTYIQGET